ncbi:MAG: hypothetical protein JXQ91_14680 [Vannielia sp.]|uniref:hypothetical protein n=1 Tax=Rhodobacterales TaxID=204455 RepID=UPI0020960D7B|nr:hypothetical protein [Oceanicola sp. 502str15]MCO6383134.1 hypothetical protein [Oceanicola sp. 502str15]
MDPNTEGRLIAQRQVIAMLVAGRGKDEILHWLEEAMRDGQEDPGAVNDTAFAIEGALADERQALAREVRLRSGG